MQHFRKPALAAVTVLLAGFVVPTPALAADGAAITQVLPLSGMGEQGEPPVYWDFMLDTGRASGAWKRIVVPSNWETQGFGTYYYGTQGRDKPDTDPIIPKETGAYRRTFEIPADWTQRQIHLVFEAAMTDTSVLINGRSAGETHQGGFYRFSYDITKLVTAGRNEIEVRVAKESANKSVNRAERRGDYWTFGGIYRPVWIEARPVDHIVWTAIDARADGSFYAQAHLNHAVAAGARLTAQVLDATGSPVGAPLASELIHGDTAIVRGTFVSPKLWSAETPSLYSVAFNLANESGSVHELKQRFGFRTLEVRPRDGVYLNGHKIVLKGINRHSFEPETGRTLTREQNFADVRLIKQANMNAVRMSHYPPDAAFLEAADELGLYVLDELAGWQGYYDTPTGARLIGQIVRRDVNHPSILFWDNGNEGGWNIENDGEFDRWDPQRRPVLHPWAIHGGINTDHYENYDSTVHLSAGPDIFMPTEFLHGLYDGGIGAGFRDYWDVMGRSPTVAGGFFWALVDEGVARSDRNGRIDNMGNAAPDGMVGPHREKEGSFFAVKEIWSPVEVSDLEFENGQLRMTLENHYDFADLNRSSFAWRAVRLPDAGSRNGPELLASGSVAGPNLAARGRMAWSFPVNARALGHNDIIELTALDSTSQPLWTWVVRSPESAAALPVRAPTPKVGTQGHSVRAGNYRLDFDLMTGRLTSLTSKGIAVALAGPRLIAWQRHENARSYDDIAGASSLRKLELAPPEAPDVLARAQYDGALREVIWRIRDGQLLVSYELSWNGTADILGVQFDVPEKNVTGKRWVGAGPYRVWKNRQVGTQFGLHETAWSRSIPGETYEYPEFEGYFGSWRWLQLQTKGANIVFSNLSGVPYFGLYRPTPVEKPVLDLPDVGWSFLYAIPAIGTKFALPDVLGPQSQATEFNGTIHGELAITVGR